MKRAAVATLGVWMFAGCDLGGREAAALRQQVAAQEVMMANLQRENDRLRAELAAQEQRMREAVVRGPAAAYAELEGRDEWTIAGERGGVAFARTIVIEGPRDGDMVKR